MDAGKSLSLDSLRHPDAIKYWHIAECIQNNLPRYLRLKEQFENPPESAILALGDKNKRWILSKFIGLNTIKKYVTLEEAIKNASENDIVIKITDINLYGVFTVDSYLNFIKNIHCDDSDNIPEHIEYHPQQIILTGWPQKIVFLCKSDDEIVEKVRGFVKKCFNEDITVIKNGDETTISINKPLVKNSTESAESFRKLIDMIDSDVGDRELAKLDLRQKYAKNHGELSYQLYSLSDGKHTTDVGTLLKELHSHRGINVILQINGNNNNIVIGNANIAQAPIDDNARALEWIRLNPPAENETSSKYHERYSASGGTVHITNLHRLVKTLGYEAKKSGGVMKWRKCKK